MKTKNHQKLTIHQIVEQALRHRAMLLGAAVLMFVGLVSFDGRMREMMRQIYDQGFGFVGTYMRHEHPAHNLSGHDIARFPSISGPA